MDTDTKTIGKKNRKEMRNRLRILECGLHNFDCKEAIQREKCKQDKFGISLPIPPIAIRCRCKNCGGVMSLLYAMPYMEAVNHIKKIGKEKENGQEKEV